MKKIDLGTGISEIRYLNVCFIRFTLLLLITVVLPGCTSKTNTPNSHLQRDSLERVDTPLIVPMQSDSIRKYSERMKRFFINTIPAPFAEKWVLPFALPDRSDIAAIQLISGFGAYRSGHQKGHKHSGIDIIPGIRMDSVIVYPANKGRVCLIRPVAPNKTVILKHKLRDGSYLYSAYTHLREIYVQNGEEVDYSTKIGVLYSKSEAKKYNGDYDHLHFEIKKRMDDYCCASWLCMSLEELNEYFDNPLVFLKRNLRQ